MIRPHPRPRPAGEAGSAAVPAVSVVIPARDASPHIDRSLEALAASDLPRGSWEVIVVDDGSTDDTAARAARYADRVIEIPSPARGPSYARNRGAEAARAELLVFVDADVAVRPETLRLIRDEMARNPDAAALFGSYDARPPAPGVVSRYRNLLHHHVHQREGPGDAETFWAGCGAVRRSTFFDVGMYDEWHFSRPQVEDIELGRRLRRHGHRILLRPRIQVAHLKRWTLRGMLVNDFRDRGVPWMRLLAHERSGAVLNARPVDRWCGVLACLASACAVSAPFLTPLLLVPAAGAVAGLAAVHARFFRLLRRSAGWRTAAAGLPLHVLYYLNASAAALCGWFAYAVAGAPPPPLYALALRELGVETDPPAARPPVDSIWYHGRPVVLPDRPAPRPTG